MINVLFSLISALMIFIILTETLSIDLYIGENYIIEIHFIVFAIVLKKSKSNKIKTAKRKSKKLKSLNFRYSLLFSLMRRSSLNIRKLNVTLAKNDPMSDALSYGIYSGLISSFLSFAENNSFFFEAHNITLSHSEHNIFKKEIEAELKLSFVDVIISCVEFLLTKARARIFYKRMRTRNE